MAKTKKEEEALSSKKAQSTLSAKPENINSAMLQLREFRVGWIWHYGRVAGLGYFSTAGGCEVVIVWDEGGSSRQQGGITDQQWEIFKLAFAGSGRIAIMSDNADWKFDYRFLEAQK